LSTIRSFRLTHRDPAGMAEAIQLLIGEDRIRFHIDPRDSALYVSSGNRTTMDAIAHLIKTLDLDLKESSKDKNGD
jgi:hypothetical protein